MPQPTLKTYVGLYVGRLDFAFFFIIPWKPYGLLHTASVCFNLEISAADFRSVFLICRGPRGWFKVAGLMDHRKSWNGNNNKDFRYISPWGIASWPTLRKRMRHSRESSSRMPHPLLEGSVTGLLGECDNSAIHHIFVVMGVCDRLKCSSNGHNRP